MADGEFHVLVVDDSAVNRMTVERLLKASSFQVTVVDSPANALRVLGSNNGTGINLILTDYNMPEMTGYDLMMGVGELPLPVRDIPVVVMSSENENDVVRRCMEGGARDFFLKPVKLSDVDKLRSYLVASNQNNNGAA